MGLRDLFKQKTKQSPGEKKPEPQEVRAKPQEPVPSEAPIGGHWGILCNTAEEVQNMCMGTATKGDSVLGAPLEGQKAIGLLAQDGAFKRVCLIAESGEIRTFYPMAEGKKHRAVFRGAYPCNPAFEGDIELTIGPATFTVFDTMYFKNHAAYKADTNYDFALSGIAYSLWRASDDKIKDKDGRELSMKGMAGLFPVPEGAPGEYAYRSPVKTVERLEANGRPILRLTTHLFYLPEESAAYGDVDIYLYVRQDRLNGYMPSVGDDVTGVMWLQGYLQEDRSSE